METYSTLRAFADSWFLIAMFGFLAGTYVWAFLPSLRDRHNEAATIPLRDESAGESGCGGDCAACACKTDFLKGLENG